MSVKKILEGNSKDCDIILAANNISVSMINKKLWVVAFTVLSVL